MNTPLPKREQERIATEHLTRLRAKYPGAKIDVMVGDNIQPDGSVFVCSEVNGKVVSNA